MTSTNVGGTSTSTVDSAFERRRAGEADGDAASDEACELPVPFPFLPLPFLVLGSSERLLLPVAAAASCRPAVVAPRPSRVEIAAPERDELALADDSPLLLETEATAPDATVVILLSPLTRTAEVDATQAELRLLGSRPPLKVLDLLLPLLALEVLLERSVGDSAWVASCLAMIFLTIDSRRLPPFEARR